MGEAEGHGEVGPVAEGEPGEETRDDSGSGPGATAGVEGSYSARHAPQGESDSALPRERRESDRREDEQGRGDRDQGRQPMAPRAGEGEQPEDDAEVLEETEEPFGEQVGAE